ncbi:CBS domain-containing protein [Capilliphycus salinus ALCB114379]|uniref:CBS domain-containing protein n=1 Tax=Capilliphycus salinus TaxID=2768948 RepID=UPI0039A4F3AA
MPPNQLPQYSSALEQAIDRNPLVVTPDTSLYHVIQLMGQLNRSNPLPAPKTSDPANNGSGSDRLLDLSQTQADCVLIVDGKKSSSSPEISTLQGIVTEQEIVQILATGLLDFPAEARLHKTRISEVMSPSEVNLVESEDQDIFTALSLFRQHQIHHLPVLDSQRHLRGVITPERIRRVLQPSNILRLRRVGDEVTRQTVTAPKTASLLSLAQMMSAHQASCVVIYQSSRKKQLTPVGIVTAFDIVQAQYLELDLSRMTAEMLLTGSSFFSLKSGDSLWVAHQEMQQQQVQRLIVCGEEGQLIGIISQMSLLRMLDPTEMYRVVRNLQQSVDQLQAEKFELLENKTAQLEDLVQERTAKLYEQLQRERLFAKISFQIHQSLDLEEILNTTVAEVRLVLNADRVLIYQVISNQSAQRVAESVAPGWHPLLDKKLKKQLVKTYLTAFETDSVYAIGNLNQSRLTPEEVERLQKEQIQAYLVVPILQDGQLWGMISTHQCSGSRQWQPSEITVLQQLATQLAIAIQQAQLYRQVQDLNTDLERQVQERTAELQQKVKELQQLNKLKDDFLSTVSHELRTPLANMKMAIHMIKLVPENDRFQRYINILEQECSRETNLINDLLDLQKLEASSTPISLETIDLSRWLPQMVQSFYSRTQERQQSLNVEYPKHLPTMQTNSGSLERILAELLNNACKYTPNGGEICLRVNCQSASETHSAKKSSKTKKTADHSTPLGIQFLISNQAEIPEKELPKIFDKFYRVPNADPWKQGGTGLGLALVQKLVEQLRGEIKVTSQKNLTTFTVDLPQ